MNAVVKEICSVVGELVEHQGVLDALVDRLATRGFALACRYDQAVSKTEWPRSEGEKIVRLAVRNGVGGVSVLFDLLHELGHVESGQPEDVRLHPSEQLRREVAAWDRAENVLLEVGLSQCLDRFRQRREYCLESYRRALPT